MDTSEKITIYTDGACKGNPGPGGWGAVIKTNRGTFKRKGFIADSTNNRMEMVAAIKALEFLGRFEKDVDLYSDSRYLVDTMNIYIHRYIRNDWKLSAKKFVKNKDLWEILVDLSYKHRIRWYWVKGHAGHLDNELADKLACDALLEKGIYL